MDLTGDRRISLDVLSIGIDAFLASIFWQYFFVINFMPNY